MDVLRFKEVVLDEQLQVVLYVLVLDPCVDSGSDLLHHLVIVKELPLHLLPLDQVLFGALVQDLFLLFKLLHNLGVGGGFAVTRLLVLDLFLIEDYLCVAFSDLDGIHSILLIQLNQTLFQLNDVI